MLDSGHIKIVARNVVDIERDPNSGILRATASGMDTRNLAIARDVETVDTR